MDAPTRGRPRAFDRAEALHQAMLVFWRQGYEGTSISDLCDAMGISSPSLYAAFGSKEELFREAISLYSATEGSGHDTLEGAPTAREGVEWMLREKARAYVDPEKPPGCMIVLSAAAGSAKTQAVRDHLSALRRESLAGMRGRFDRAVQEGELPPETDTGALAGQYAALLNGLSYAARDGATAEELDAIIDSAMASWDAMAYSRNR